MSIWLSDFAIISRNFAYIVYSIYKINESKKILFIKFVNNLL